MPTSLPDFFLDYEPQDEITSPTDYPYLIILGQSLSVISCRPLKILDPLDTRALQRRKIWVAIQRFFHSFMCFITFVGSITYILFHWKSMTFFELGHLYISILINTVVIARITTLTFSTNYRELAKEFLTKFHLFCYKDRSEFTMKTHKMVHLVCHLYTLWLVGQMFVGLSLFNLIPMYSNYAAGRYKSGGLQNSTFEHSMYFVYPAEINGYIGYIVACVIHWFLSYLCSTWFCIFDLFLSIMVFHIWGHFKILINSLDQFPRPSSNSNIMLENGFVIHSEQYSKEEQLQVAERLKECIIYHREIVHFIDTVSHVFGPMLFVYMMFHQACGCLLLLECSQMTTQALMRYGPLTIISTQQLVQLSVIFELVGTESEKLKHAVYGVPWECMDTKNRKVVRFFLMNVQQPVHVKALGVANVGVTSMAAILKTSVSYFAFLRTV